MPTSAGNKVVYFLVVISLFSCSGPGKKMFQSLSPSQTNISFQNDLPNRPGLSILYYLYYYAGGGVSIGDVNNDGLPDIYFTANTKGNNKLYLNKGNFQFEDITAKAGVAGSSDWSSGVTMADVNGDGWLDIYVCAITNKLGLKGHNELFINNKDGTFTESAALYGLDLACYSVQAAFFDYDHDGDLDCFVLNESDQPFQNIVDTSHRRNFSPFSGARLLRNDLNTAAKRFSDISSTAGIYQSVLGYGLGLAVADLNNDGWDDIYVGNDFHENDYYYINNGNGTFTESGAKHFRHYSRFSMGNDIADYNNDGQPDIVTADMLPDKEKVLKTYGSDENADIYQFKVKNNGFQDQYSRNCLQTNNGSGGSFSETGLLAGVSATDWSWTPLLADFDNDGNKDLFVTSGIVKRTTDLDYVRFISGEMVRKKLNNSLDLDEEAISKMPDGISHCFIYKGDGKTGFKDVSADWGLEDIQGYFTGAAYADLDNDGRLDLVTNRIGAPATIFKNNAAPKNYLSIVFKGSEGNLFGIGAKAWLFAKDKMQYQELTTTRGFQSSSEPKLHFGLDTLTTIDSILIVWPDQKFQVIDRVSTGKTLTVSNKDGAGKFDYSSFFPPATELLSTLPGAQVNWKHKENNFSDFNVQFLIPHSESTRGPKLAIADVNGDGLQDFFACGAKGQAGTLFIQQANGKFISTDTSLFKKDSKYEDVDAVFFDANGDKFPDLYVVSGGNEAVGSDSVLLDRLYINDGKGNFTKSPDALPAVFANKSCVSIADVDHDGDNDIFIGTLADAHAYGVPQASHLLLNDGHGKFSLAGQDIMPLADLGMVTSSAFGDINGDGWPDLVVCGEWMDVIVFINQHGHFTKSVIPHSSGIWQKVFVDDVNGDGKPDLLAGNWGWNNKFWSGKNGPCKLYVGDFDKNGRVDQLLSYTKDGIEFPFLAKDEVERQLPLLKKHYLYYAEYAGVPMKEVFYGWIDTVKPYPAERLGSAVFFGDGKGNFTITDLPPQLQTAPVFSFRQIAGENGEKTYIAGGNFFDVIPYEGKYDAQALALFTVSGDNKVNWIRQPLLSNVNGQVRDVQWIDVGKNGNELMVARNNDSLAIFKKIKLK